METVILGLVLCAVQAALIAFAVSIRRHKSDPKCQDECKSKVASEELPRIKLNGQIGVPPMKEQRNDRTRVHKEDS